MRDQWGDCDEVERSQLGVGIFLATKLVTRRLHDAPREGIASDQLALAALYGLSRAARNDVLVRVEYSVDALVELDVVEAFGVAASPGQAGFWRSTEWSFVRDEQRSSAIWSTTADGHDALRRYVVAGLMRRSDPQPKGTVGAGLFLATRTDRPADYASFLAHVGQLVYVLAIAHGRDKDRRFARLKTIEIVTRVRRRGDGAICPTMYLHLGCSGQLGEGYGMTSEGVFGLALNPMIRMMEQRQLVRAGRPEGPGVFYTEPGQDDSVFTLVLSGEPKP